MLPAGFEDLEVFDGDWALTRESERMTQRCATKLEDIRRFYDAMIDRVKAALDHLDTFPLEAMPGPEMPDHSRIVEDETAHIRSECSSSICQVAAPA